MPDKTCYLCKKWDGQYCSLSGVSKDSTDSCGMFDSIPCCQDCKYWTRDYDDYSVGRCSFYGGNTPYDSVCNDDMYKSKSVKSSSSSSTYHSKTSNSYSSGSKTSSSYSSNSKSRGKGLSVFLAIIAIIAVGYFVSSNYSISRKTSESSYSVEYLFPSDTVLLTESDLKDKSKEELALMRNEIFARKGYIFQTEPYKSYFNSKSWYKPNSDFSVEMFNQTEKENINIILQAESNK